MYLSMKTEVDTEFIMEECFRYGKSVLVPKIISDCEFELVSLSSQSEVEGLPKDKWGDVKTVSLKSWIKRNDTRKLIDYTYTYGKIRFIGGRSIKSVNIKSAHDTYDDYVDEVFHRQLKECENKEREYFLEHDEYSILKREFLNNKYNTTFGVNITSWSSGKVCICDDVTKEEREITIEELKYLLSRYKELDELVEKITKETHITY